MILHRFGNIELHSQAVDAKAYFCHRCSNDKRALFHTYYSEYYKGNVTYCMNCVTLGAMTDKTPLNAYDIETSVDLARFELRFDLTKAQACASEEIVSAFLNNDNVLLQAVTGAGKTEVTFQCIHEARKRGQRVAYVAPRIDVIKEIYMRLTDAFKHARIDLKYDGVKVEFEHEFVVCTVQQLYNYVNHFHLIIVDETDAFPLTSDDLLMRSIATSAHSDATILYMTATPTTRMKSFLGSHQRVTINARYHGHPLAMPNIHYRDVLKGIQKERVDHTFLQQLKETLSRGRKVLVFVPEIRLMLALERLLAPHFSDVMAVHSQSKNRYTLVDKMREGKINLLLTTTILERGVTFEMIDVFVIGADQYDASSLIQICGRVGRKVSDPIGNIYMFTEVNTRALQETIKYIKTFNGEQ